MTRIILFFLCSALSVSMFAQEVEIPRGANKILVKNNKSAAENFLFVKGVLAEQGVEIIRQDQDVKQISTGLLLFKAGGSFAVLIYCKNNEIQVVAKFISEGALGSTLANKGTFSNAFLAVNTFVKHFGKDVSYLIDNDIENRY